MQMQGMQVRSLSWEDPVEEETATLYIILALKIPWIEEPTFHGVAELDVTEQLNTYLSTRFC